MTYFRPLSRETLTLQVIIAVKRFISEENLPAGTKLPSERDLSGSLSVSRNIVREALSALMHEGIIVKQAGKGNFVADFDRDIMVSTLPLAIGDNDPSAQELREARAALEIGCVGLIVQRITQGELEQLEEVLSRYERKHHDGKTTIKEDIEFHVLLLTATKNQVIEDMIPLVHQVFLSTLAVEPSAIRQNPDRIVVEHRRILEALKAKDIGAAREAMQAHFRLQDFPI